LRHRGGGDASPSPEYADVPIAGVEQTVGNWEPMLDAWMAAAGRPAAALNGKLRQDAEYCRLNPQNASDPGFACY
jgi:hypothetical protein